MSLARKVAHNTIIQVAGKIVSTFLGLLALALITRYLGPSGFGEYTTVLTYLSFFAVIADLGLTLVTVQMVSDRGNDESKTLNNLFGLRLVSVLLLLVWAPIIVIFLPYSAAIKTGVTLSLAAFFFPALNQVVVGLFQKKLSMDRDAIAEVISRLVLVGGVLFAKDSGAGLNGILLATVAAAGINFFCHYSLACKFIIIKPEFDWTVWKKIITRSWPLAVTIILNLIYLRADTLILSLLRSTSEVGLYGATYKIVDVMTTFPFMFAGLILPILTAAWLDRKPEYFNHVLQKSLDFMIMLAVPLAVGAQFLGRPVMLYVAGRDFAPAGQILQVLIFAVAAIFLGTMFSHAVIALDRQKKMIGPYVFTSLSALAAYLILIPRFSYFGAASVTIYSETAIAIFSALCVFKYSRFRPNLKMLARALAGSLIMGLFLHFFGGWQDTRERLAIIFIAASLIYFAALYLLGGIRRSDLAIIFKSKSGGGPAFGGTNL
jgi:O-antigen/teichoic acid export membrane protein